MHSTPIISSPLIVPPSLNRADRIAIIAPSGAVNPALIDSAAAVIAAEGFAPVVMPHAKGRSGSFAGTVADRFADLAAAVTDRSIRAILCARGGFGAVHLIPAMESLPLRANAKWLVGFSDISALHALWSANGIASIHGPMARHLSTNGSGHPATQALFALLRGEKIEVTTPAHPLNRPGRTAGTLLGGNLAVLHGLIGSPYDMLRPDSILVIEDINEPIYRIERMLWQMKLSGVLPRLRGLIVGNFKGAEADANYQSVEAMIAEMVAPYDFPVAFSAPVGHILENMPLRLTAPAVMSVDSGGSLLIE